MATRAVLPSFVCDDCGSRGIAIHGPLTDTAPVACDGCGRDLGPWDIFLDELQTELLLGGVINAEEDHELRQRRTLRRRA